MPDDWPIEELFDDDYLHFSAARLADEVSDADSAIVWDLLDISEGIEVLDLACGHGRIANRLAERGARVVGVDATPRFLDMARNDAARRHVDVEYVEADMRSIPWSDRFDVVVSWFTAFGYFDDEQNRGVLRSVHRALRSGGRFLIELNHKDGLLPHWVPSSVVQTDEGLMIDERVYDPLTGRADATRTIARQGTVRRSTFFTRLFSFTELRDWLLQAGFRSVTGLDGAGARLTASSTRMILIAQK
jgi:SAM-dependent methyltransferase